jgi:hypothetical protein
VTLAQLSRRLCSRKMTRPYSSLIPIVGATNRSAAGCRRFDCAGMSTGLARAAAVAGSTELQRLAMDPRVPIVAGDAPPDSAGQQGSDPAILFRCSPGCLGAGTRRRTLRRARSASRRSSTFHVNIQDCDSASSHRTGKAGGRVLSVALAPGRRAGSAHNELMRLRARRRRNRPSPPA